MDRPMRETMLCVSNGQNPLGEKTARRLHGDLHAAETTTLRLCTQLWTYSFYPARDARVKLLLRACAVSLQCIVFALLFIDEILYNDVPISDPKTMILCTRGARGCNAETVFFARWLPFIEQGNMRGREARTMRR